MLINQKPRVLILQAKGKPRGCQLWCFPWVTAIWSRGAQSMSNPHQPGWWLVVNHHHLRDFKGMVGKIMRLYMFILKPFMVILGSMDGLFLGLLSLLYYHKKHLWTRCQKNGQHQKYFRAGLCHRPAWFDGMGGMGRFLSFLWNHQVFPWTKCGCQALDFQMVQSATSIIYDGLRS